MATYDVSNSKQQNLDIGLMHPNNFVDILKVLKIDINLF